jgi:hypothetical protein
MECGAVWWYVSYPVLGVVAEEQFFWQALVQVVETLGGWIREVRMVWRTGLHEQKVGN